MPRFFGTFKYSSPLRANFVIVIEDNREQAYKVMAELYHADWSMLYDEEHFVEQPEKYQLTEIPLGMGASE